MSNVLVGLAIIQLDLSAKGNPPFILSKKEDKFVLPTTSKYEKLEILRESLFDKHVDLSLSWVNFNLIDVTHVLRNEVTIIYGCMVPFSTKIKEGFWLKTNIDNTEQFDIAIKTLRSFGNI